jgi:hypothetical protein
VIYDKAPFWAVEGARVVMLGQHRYDHYIWHVTLDGRFKGKGYSWNNDSLLYFRDVAIIPQSPLANLLFPESK